MINLINRIFIGGGKYRYLEDRYRQIFKDTKYFIDISGFALSSAYGYLSAFNYVTNIMNAKKNSAPFYIFPQSIGPFNQPFSMKIPLYLLLCKYLKYPKKIFVREKQSYNYAKKFSAKNIEKTHDLVLQSSNTELMNSFNKMSEPHEIINVCGNSVGIIPSFRTMQRMSKESFEKTYRAIIETLLNKGKKVYLFRHSYEDLETCNLIKEYFYQNDDVMIIEKDLEFNELSQIISKMDLIIASRYHSIINSYINAVPVISIGWAVKYKELLKEFDQGEYFVDCQSKSDLDSLINKVSNILENHSKNREKILRKISEIKKIDIFNVLNTQL
jgi:colanic acid/amylovoran biosynthesis protein